MPRTDEEREKYAEELVPFEGKWIPIEKRRKAIEKKIEEQRERIAEDRAHSTWGNRRFDETKNFLWEYTVPQHIIEAFQARCENYYTQFTKDWKVKRTGREKMRIRFFQSGREFNKTAAGGGGGALAYFVIIPPYEICIFYDRTSFEFTEMVLYHELSHYLQKLINQEFRIPHWPGEGVSEYYGGALWNDKKKGLDIGLIQEGRLSSVLSQYDGGKRFSLVEMLSQPKYEDYSWGWTLVHFMMGDKRYKKGFQNYLKGIANDRKVNRIKMGLGAQIIDGIEPAESVEYFKKSLKLKSDEDVATFEKEWYAYIDEALRKELPRQRDGPREGGGQRPAGRQAPQGQAPLPGGHRRRQRQPHHLRALREHDARARRGREGPRPAQACRRARSARSLLVAARGDHRGRGPVGGRAYQEAGPRAGPVGR